MARTLSQRRAEEAEAAANLEKAIIECSLSDQEALDQLRHRAQIFYDSTDEDSALGRIIRDIFEKAMDPRSLYSGKTIALVLKETLVSVERAFRADEKRAKTAILLRESATPEAGGSAVARVSEQTRDAGDTAPETAQEEHEGVERENYEELEQEEDEGMREPLDTNNVRIPSHEDHESPRSHPKQALKHPKKIGAQSDDLDTGVYSRLRRRVKKSPSPPPSRKRKNLSPPPSRKRKNPSACLSPKKENLLPPPNRESLIVKLKLPAKASKVYTEKDSKQGGFGANAPVHESLTSKPNHSPRLKLTLHRYQAASDGETSAYAPQDKKLRPAPASPAKQRSKRNGTTPNIKKQAHISPPSSSSTSPSSSTSSPDTFPPAVRPVEPPRLTLKLSPGKSTPSKTMRSMTTPSKTTPSKTTPSKTTPSKTTPGRTTTKSPTPTKKNDTTLMPPPPRPNRITPSGKTASPSPSSKTPSPSPSSPHPPAAPQYKYPYAFPPLPAQKSLKTAHDFHLGYQIACSNILDDHLSDRSVPLLEIVQELEDNKPTFSGEEYDYRNTVVRGAEFVYAVVRGVVGGMGGGDGGGVKEGEGEGERKVDVEDLVWCLESWEEEGMVRVWGRGVLDEE